MTDKTIEDLDLHAYVDGLLNDDPQRKTEVETYLRQSPEAMQRVNAFRAQNAALQKAFGDRIAAPVPQRLYDALNAQPRRNGRRVAIRAAAMAASLFVAGLAGWMLGLNGGGDGMLSAAVDQSYQHFAAAPSDTGASPPPVAGAAQPADARIMAGDIGIGLKAPDLSRAGYELTQEWQVSAGGTEMVRLDYDLAGTAGMAQSASTRDEQGFSLFFAPRWSPEPERMTAAERDGVSIVYWLEGSYVSTLVTRMPPAEAERAAAAVREAMAAERRQPASSGRVAAPATQPPLDAVPLQVNTEAVQH